MNYLDHQDNSRHNSRWLVFYFALAVPAAALSVYLLASFILYVLEVLSSPAPNLTFEWLDTGRVVWLGGGTLLVILFASAYKTAALSQGGACVARLLGGSRIDPGSSDVGERRLLNVVEETAIACGIRPPGVYLMEREAGINAFAAGRSAEDAVIGVTRGTVAHLSRDELHGLVAHEFAHILNGDMRLNFRLMGVLHGILIIALAGYCLQGRGRRAVASNRHSGPFELLGLCLVVVGYAGVFFARLIKSAVSREREFLADASAVELTRNPDGIAGALKKIGGLAQGSRMTSPHAEEASHLFFSDGDGGMTSPSRESRRSYHWLDTHPPLSERIRRLDPAWTGRFPEVRLVASDAASAKLDG